MYCINFYTEHLVDIFFLRKVPYINNLFNRPLKFTTVAIQLKIKSMHKMFPLTSVVVVIILLKKIYSTNYNTSYPREIKFDYNISNK